MVGDGLIATTMNKQDVASYTQDVLLENDPNGPDNLV